MSRIVEPQPGTVLVKLPTSALGNVKLPVKEYDSSTSGVVLMVNKADKGLFNYLLGREVYYRKFKDDARLPFDQTLVMIEIKDILGSSYEQ